MLADGVMPAPAPSPVLRLLANCCGKFIRWRTDGEIDVVTDPDDGVIREKVRHSRLCDRRRQRKRRQLAGDGTARGLDKVHRPWTDKKLPPHTRRVVIVTVRLVQRFIWRGWVNPNNPFDRWILDSLCVQMGIPWAGTYAWGVRKFNWSPARIAARRANPFYRRHRKKVVCHSGSTYVRGIPGTWICTDFADHAELDQWERQKRRWVWRKGHKPGCFTHRNQTRKREAAADERLRCRLQAKQLSDAIDTAFRHTLPPGGCSWFERQQRWDVFAQAYQETIAHRDRLAERGMTRDERIRWQLQLRGVVLPYLGRRDYDPARPPGHFRSAR